MTMAHNAKCSLFFKQKESFEQFLKDTNAIMKDFPTTIDAFEQRYEMRFVMTNDRPIQQQISFARGAYVKFKMVPNLVQALDSYFAWRQSKSFLGFFPEVDIHIANCIEVDIPKDADYECSINVSNHETRVDIPFS